MLYQLFTNIQTDLINHVFCLEKSVSKEIYQIYLALSLSLASIPFSSSNLLCPLLLVLFSTHILISCP